MRFHSVEHRFLAIIFASFVVFAVPAFVLFLILSSEREATEIRTRSEIMLRANATALGKPLWDFDVESVHKITRAILTSDSVQKVVVHDTAGQVDLQLSSPHARAAKTTTITGDIYYESQEGSRKVGTLEMDIEDPTLFSVALTLQFTFFWIFASAVAVMTATAIIGNRMFVMRPLLRLTAAIAATRQLGSRHKVDWTSDDEVGALAASFNEMQDRLANDERDLRAAHELVTVIYNETPAMLFSVDKSNQLTAVSDYWSEITGYEREMVLQRSFCDFLEPESRPVFERRSGGGAITLRFRCADNRVMDILVRETEVTHAEQAMSLLVMTDVTSLKEAESRNLRNAITDHLTGQLNRLGFERALKRAIDEVRRTSGAIICLFVDLDRFKAINDTLGHAAGDQVLTEVAHRLRACCGEDAILARLGGDEFAVLVRVNTDETVDRSTAVARSIVDDVERPMQAQGHTVSISASVGVAFYPDHAESGEELLRKSDMAMYAQKREGKNGFQAFTATLEQAALDRARVEANIEDGLREDWFEAWLQPTYDLHSGLVIGFEALMRLNHPRDGLLSTGPIVQVAEETGTIGAIGRAIFEKALAGFARLATLDDFANAHVAVNFAPQQFDHGLLEFMMAALARHRLRPSQVIVEITEAALMQQSNKVKDILALMRATGFRIALDDFGTGYSSLSYLNSFSVDIIKIDQSFTRTLTSPHYDEQRRSRLLIEGISAIAHKMGCEVIAEGVETIEQENLLKEIGIRIGQGYLFCRPSRIDDLMVNLQPKSPIRLSL